MVEILRECSKHGDRGESTILLIEEAVRCCAEALEGQTPSRNQTYHTSPRSRVRILTDDEVAELVSAYKAGDSTYALSRRFGIRRETVVGHLDRQGIMRRSIPRVDLDLATRDQILKLGRDGTSVHRIAKMFGLTERVVARTLDAAGIERRKAHQTTTP